MHFIIVIVAFKKQALSFGVWVSTAGVGYRYFCT
jgi:hypothetical protein